MKVFLIFILFFINSYAVELVNEQFSSNINGWSVSSSSKVYHSSSYGGSMFIDRKDRGWRTYQFGPTYANQNLDVTLEWCATDQWESNNDYLRVKINGTTSKTDYNDGGCRDVSFSKNTDSDGDFKIEFSPRSSSNNEDAYIKWVKVNGSPLSGKYICPGETIMDLNQTTVSATSSDSGTIPANTTYYYQFTPAVDGTIQVSSHVSASANSLYIKSGCNSNLWSKTNNSNDKSSPAIDVTASQHIVIALERRANSSRTFNIDFDFVANIPKTDLSLSESTPPSPLKANINEDINISVSVENIGVADADANVVLLASYNQDVNITSASELGSNDFSCTPSSGLLSTGSSINCTMPSSFAAGANTKNFSFGVRATSLGELIQTSVISSQTDDSNSTNNTLQSTSVDIRTPGYCELNALEQGYHIIDPDGDDYVNSFEIYCDRSDPSDIKDVLKLPMSDEMNTAEFSNFTFNSSISSDRNYYNSSHAKAPINYIRINANTLEVIADDSSGFFNGDFSSLNLRGTPFTFDWENLSNDDIQGCDLALMRLDYDSNNKSGGQTLKINPKLENVYKCSSNSLKLKFLDEYKYLKYLSDEVLAKSCKSMSSVLPDIGEYASITGYYYIDPNEIGREANQDLSDYRPFVTYCMEVAGNNPEDQYSWTMFLTLDGKRTDHHNDVKNKVDSCTNLGLIFFVPNEQSTFNKVKDFLYGQRDQWKEYTGKMSEYFTDRNIAGWGSSHETTRDYWPYGPMGLYYDGSTSHWNPTIKNGRWVNGVKYGYDLTSTSEVDGTSINIAHLSNGNGWTTTLEDLNISNDFWITNFSAGSFNNSASACSGSNTDKCYLDGRPGAEPNGDYDSGNWMHFWADDNGDIYHYNDQNNANKYNHDHYMCIAPDNYDVLYRFGLTDGPFSVIEGGQTILHNNSINTLSLPITTKIVKKPLDFDIVIFDEGMNNIDEDQNISAGLFLTTIEYDDSGNESPKDLHAFGQLIGGSPDLSIISTNSGYAELSSSFWPNNSNTIDSAYKKVFFQFKYCSQDNMLWTDCWDYYENDKTALCNQGGCSANEANCICKTAESDPFAVRPDHFAINSNGLTTVKAEDVNISYYAYDFANGATNLYNEDTNDSFTISTSIADVSKTCVNSGLTLSTPSGFINGENHGITTFSDVGQWVVDIQETAGSEYAIVDKDDTSDINRYITPASTTLTVLPDHFSISPITQINVLNNYTYLSNDLENMGLIFDFSVSAKNSSDVITQNYSTTCYANNINLDIKYSATNGNMPSNIIYHELNSTIEGNNTATDNLLSLPKNVGDFLPSTLFTTDNNGVADLRLRVNFQRNKSNALNPFVINFNDINVSDQSTSLIISNDDTHTINLDANMLYGRTHAPRQRFSGTTGTALINYEVYCYSTDSSGTSCDKSILPGGASSNYTDDPRWFLNSSHDTTSSTLGDVSQKGSSNAITVGTVVNNNPAQVPLTYDNSSGSPYKTTMENNASSWLIYNKFNANDTTNEFEVEFEESNSSWVGQHETDTTTNRSGTNMTNRRTMW
ncbi:hypothetical protein [Sulfurimonas sp.]